MGARLLGRIPEVRDHACRGSRGAVAQSGRGVSAAGSVLVPRKSAAHVGLGISSIPRWSMPIRPSRAPAWCGCRPIPMADYWSSRRCRRRWRSPRRRVRPLSGASCFRQRLSIWRSFKGPRRNGPRWRIGTSARRGRGRMRTPARRCASRPRHGAGGRSSSPSWGLGRLPTAYGASREQQREPGSDSGDHLHRGGVGLRAGMGQRAPRARGPARRHLAGGNLHGVAGGGQSAGDAPHGDPRRDDRLLDGCEHAPCSMPR